jgi:hypothetical protein
VNNGRFRQHGGDAQSTTEKSVQSLFSPQATFRKILEFAVSAKCHVHSDSGYFSA